MYWWLDWTLLHNSLSPQIIRLSRNKIYLVKCQPWKWQSLVFRNSCHQLTYKNQFIYHKKILASSLNRFIKRIALKNLFQKPALVGAIFKIISHRGQLRGSVVKRLKLWTCNPEPWVQVLLKLLACYRRSKITSLATLASDWLLIWLVKNAPITDYESL